MRCLLLPTAETQRERRDFTLLLKEMYPACQGAGLLLTAATKALNTEPHYELQEIHKYLDWWVNPLLLLHGTADSKLNH
jgi:hypothetical protein